MLSEVQRAILASNGKSPKPLLVADPTMQGHINCKADYWTFSGWRADEVKFNPRKIIDEVERVELELYYDLINNRQTTPRPIYFENNFNKLTLIGLTQSAKRDTDEVATSLDWNSLGTDSTTPTENDTNLTAEDTGGSYARRQYSVNGQRKVVNQTSKFGMLWDDGDVSAVPINLKESGLHWGSSGADNIHAHVTFTTFNMTSGDLFVSQINELHENGA